MSNFTDEVFNYTRTTDGVDPGAIGAGKVWVDISQEPPAVSVRNKTNTGWDPIGGIGKSYLATFLNAYTILTGTPEPMAYDSPADSHAGTDVSISGDGKTFTINTTGWYLILLIHEFSPTSSAALGSATAVIPKTGLDAGDLYSVLGPQAVVVPIDGGISTADIQFTQPIFSNFKAGDAFQVLASATMSAGAVAYSAAVANAIQIHRLS